MHVLIANDDGIGACGIKALAQAFIDAGHRVSVAAPDTQRSAASHSITMFRPLMARPVEWPGAMAWSIDGTPADCVKLALDKLTGPVDVVVSGINDGYNIGTDVHYSGTVAAAMEGAFAGFPAIAVSVPFGRHDLCAAAAQTALKAADRLYAKQLLPMTVLNINLPDVQLGATRGERAAELSRLRYDGAYLEQENPRVGKYYWLVGKAADEQEAGENDVSLLRKGFITYTVLNFDWTSHGAAERFLQE